MMVLYKFRCVCAHNIQGLKELGEGEEVDREVSPPILNIEENEQQENLHEVNRELGNPPRFFPFSDLKLGHSLLKCPMTPQW
jgi:hypothetical protein